MNFEGIVWWRVAVAAIAAFLVGGLWYSPMLFARPWMKAMGYDPDDKKKVEEMQKGKGLMLAAAFVCSVLSATVLAKVIAVMGI